MKHRIQAREDVMPPIRFGGPNQVQLLTPQTVALEARQLEAFLSWCSRWISDDDLDFMFSVVPQFLADALRAYGEWLFAHGGALSNYHHLVLAVQRWKPASRTFMMVPWQLLQSGKQSPRSHSGLRFLKASFAPCAF